jgi:hypothetical protein
MSINRLPVSNARPTVSGDDPEAPASARPPLSSGVSSIGGWLLSELRSWGRRRVPAAAADPPQGSMAHAPAEVLLLLAQGTLNPEPWPEDAAAQLARLKGVNRGFRDAAEEVERTRPELRHAAMKLRMQTIITATLREWKQEGTTHSLDRIRDVDHVIVDLRMLEVPRSHCRRPELATAVLDGFLRALDSHPGLDLHGLDVVAAGNDLLRDMMRWVAVHPDVLRSLEIETTPDTWMSLLFIGQSLFRQNNLATLTLRHIREKSDRRMSLRETGLTDPVASLAGLKNLSLCDVGRDAADLIAMLGRVPRLEVLNLTSTRRNEPGLDAAAFKPIISALQGLGELRSLNLTNSLPDHTSVDHLADVLASLPQLQALDLSCNPMPLDDWSRLIWALAKVPALQRLDLSVPGEHWAPIDAVALVSALGPLAQRQGMQLHLQGLNEEGRSLLRAALPRLLAPPRPLVPLRLIARPHSRLRVW